MPRPPENPRRPAPRGGAPIPAEAPVRVDGTTAQNPAAVADTTFDHQVQASTDARLAWKAAVYQAELRKHAVKDLMRFREQYGTMADAALKPVLDAVTMFLREEKMIP
jgi:hypothetical protein